MSIPNWVQQLNAGTWRGLSAYEVAVQNGYTGTETQWLASLKGADGAAGENVTVNGKSAIGGNITVRGTDIPIASGMSQTVYAALQTKLDGPAVDDLTTGGQSALSAEQGKTLKTGLDSKVKKMSCTIASTAWTEADEGYSASASVPGMTASGVLIVSPDPTNGYTAWCENGVRCVSQSAGQLTFSADTQPDSSIVVNLCLMTGGDAE